MPTGTRTQAVTRVGSALLLLVAAATTACGVARAAGPAATRGAATSSQAEAPLTLRVLRPLATGHCPLDPLRLTAADANLARAAVLLALPAQPNPTGAVVRVVPMDRIDRAYAVHRCGARVADRSLVVNASLPRVRFSAALSYDTFYVARTPRGWSLWDLTPGGGG
jgi:hypothetical protein